MSSARSSARINGVETGQKTQPCGRAAENESAQSPSPSDEMSPEYLSEHSEEQPSAANQERYAHEQDRCWFIKKSDPNGTCETVRPMRKVISHYFGRNKSCTRAIPDDAIIFFCRPHYQRALYEARISTGKARFTHVMVKDQVKLMTTKIPSLTWTISFQPNLRKAFEEFAPSIPLPRLAGMMTSTGRKRSARKPQKAGTRVQRDRAQAYSPDQLEWIKKNLVPLLGSGKTTAQVKYFLTVFEKKLDRRFFKELPEFELLPKIESN